MYRATLITITVCCIALFVLPPNSKRTEAQSNFEKPITGIFSTEDTIRRDGWQIPEAFSKNRSVSRKLVVNGKNVTMQILTTQNLIVDYEDYFVISRTEVRIIKSKMKIVAGDALSVNGKIFQYSIRYEPFRGVESDVSSVQDVKYIDRDGDGVFELRTRASAKASLPDWVRDLE